MRARWSVDAPSSPALPSRVIGSSAAGSSAPIPHVHRPIGRCAGTGPFTASTSSARARACHGFRLLHRLPKKHRVERGWKMADCFCACRRPGASSRTTPARARRALTTASASAACAATAPTVAPWHRRRSSRCRSASRRCLALTAYSSDHRAQTLARRCPRLHRSRHCRRHHRPEWHVPNRRNRPELSPELSLPPHCLPNGRSHCQSGHLKSHLRKLRPHPRRPCTPRLSQHRPLQLQTRHQLRRPRPGRP
jgi:hypothetical protein